MKIMVSACLTGESCICKMEIIEMKCFADEPAHENEIIIN